jgi:hypothetical protein
MLAAGPGAWRVRPIGGIPDTLRHALQPPLRDALIPRDGIRAGHAVQTHWGTAHIDVPNGVVTASVEVRNPGGVDMQRAQVPIADFLLASSEAVEAALDRHRAALDREEAGVGVGVEAAAELVPEAEPEPEPEGPRARP